MNSLKRGIGTRINLVLCVAMSIAFGLLTTEHTALAQSPKVVRIDGKDYPVATFAGPTQPVKTPTASDPANSTETKVELPRSLAVAEIPSLSFAATGSPFTHTAAQAPVRSIPSLDSVPVVKSESNDLAFVDLTPKSRELLDDYSALPEVKLELIRGMFAEQSLEPMSKPRIAATLVSNSLEGLGLSEVNEQNVQAYTGDEQCFQIR